MSSIYIGNVIHILQRISIQSSHKAKGNKLTVILSFWLVVQLLLSLFQTIFYLVAATTGGLLV